MTAFPYLLIGLITFVLILLLIWQNRKDRKDFTDTLNHDYRHPKNEEGDIEIDEVKK